MILFSFSADRFILFLRGIRLRRLSGGLFLILLLSGPASGADRAELTVPRTDTAPLVDGVLNDAAWKNAAHIDRFYQRVPTEGAPASEKTEVWLTYDKDHIYVAVRLHDREPDLIVAQELREDEKLITGDLFAIAFDSMHDRRNAFLFAMNPLGTKSEARIEDNDRFRFEWDGIWRGASSRDDSGWYLEYAIPFKTLSINKDTPVWGMEMERYIRRRNEWVYWANHDQDKRITYVAAYGALKGLHDVDQGKGLDIRPQMAVRQRDKQGGDNNDFSIRSGAEIIYKVRPSLNASLIINPDFSNTIVDDIKTNLTRFDLFYPEQRDFFVRDADIFQFGGLDKVNGIPFFSRRIGLPFDVENPDPLQIDVGAKLSGRLGRYTLGLLNTQVGSGQGMDSQNLSVARITRDVQAESRIGGMMTYGNPVSDDDNGVAGIDYRFRDSQLFGSQVFVADAWLMKSFSEGIDSDDLSYGLSLDFPNDRWNGQLRYKEIQKNFNPALGFVNRTGIREYEGNLRYRIRPANNRFFRAMNWGFKSTITTTTDNNIASGKVYVRFFDLETHVGDKATLWGNWYHEELFVPFEIQPGIVIPAGNYNFYTIWGSVNTSNHRPVSIAMKYEFGEFFNGNKTDVLATVEWRPLRYFLLSLERRVFDVRLPAGDFEFEINRARFNINFTPTLSWTNYLQQESETHFMTLQSQLRWIMTPGNELTLTLNHDWEKNGGSYKNAGADLFARVVWTHRF